LRDVFHGIHKEHLENEESKSRLRNFLSEEFLKLPPGHIDGKTIADLGAGSGVVGTINLLEMGAVHVHALDLDDSYTETARPILENEAEYVGRWTLDIGNVLDLPYDDNSFEFVVCQGTLHHTKDEMLGLREIYRVLSPGCKAFVTFGGGSEGLMNKFFRDTLHAEYRASPLFAQIVDNHLSVEWVHDQIDWLLGNIEKDDSQSYDNSVILLESPTVPDLTG